MKNLIPQMIAEKAVQHIYHGHFPCYSLLFDISGFTVITNALMDMGKEGAEILSVIIEDIFTPAINAVYQNRGLVAVFGGDSVTAIFPVKEAEYALQSAFSIHRLFLTQGLVKTKVGDFPLAAKIGLSCGDVSYQIIDAQVQKAFYFRGTAISGCARAEGKAQDMEVVAHCDFISQLTVEVDTKPIDAAHVSIPYCADFSFKEPYSLQREPWTGQDVSAAETAFVPKAVLDLEGRGEFRDIVSCYIHFKEEGDYQGALAQVIQNCCEYGGYCNKVYFDDRGGFSLVLFGAPEGKENLYQRGAEFALRITDIPGFQCRIGLASGTAFSGFFGSHLRKEYTALGSVVNLSARFMMAAAWGQIRIDRRVAKNLQQIYQLEWEGFSPLKGFHQQIEMFSLRGPMEKVTCSYTDIFVGREEETILLQEYMQPIFKGKFGGIVYIDGAPGIGKSRFMANFQQRMTSAQFLYLPCDEILQKAFNPFVHYFKSYFQQSQNAADAVNKERFVDRYGDLLKQVTHAGIKRELVRTKSIIGALMDLEWEDSLFQELDSRKRYENTLFAVKNFFMAQSLLRPTVMLIEDGQWIDHDSLEVMKVMVRSVEDYPFILCALCRPRDDGTEVELLAGEEIDVKRIEMPAFPKACMEELVLDRLKAASIPQDTQDFIWDKSLGNPFFAEQFLLYLQENDLLDRAYHVQVASHTIPEAIHQIIMARIDRLTIKLKETVKAASVLGREFAVQVLRKILSRYTVTPEKEFQEDLMDISKQQLWDMISELNILFKHALIRDVVYEMQLKETLRSLHNTAAGVIEELYHDNVKAFYEELAEHYDMAANREKAIEYLEKAGDQAKENYQNNQALSFYDKLLPYVHGKEDVKAAAVLLKKGAILQLVGQWDEAMHVYEEVLALAKALPDDILGIDCMLQMSIILVHRGRIHDAVEVLEESLKMSKEIGYKEGMREAILAQGDIYSLQGEYTQAMDCYQKALHISQEIGDARGVGSVFRSMGTSYCYQNDFKNAMKSYQRSIAIAQEVGDRQEIYKSYNSIGTLYYYQEDYLKALQYMEKGLTIGEEIGDKSGSTTVFGNIGVIYSHSGNFAKAIEYLEKALSMGQELDMKKEIAYASNNMGFVYSKNKEYTRAMDCYKQALTILEGLGHITAVNQLLTNIGICYYNQGNFPQAMDYFDRSLSMLKEEKNIGEILNVTESKALIHFQTGDYAAAMDLVKEALCMSEEYTETANVRMAYDYDTICCLLLLKGDIYQAEGDFDRAMECYDRSIQLYKERVKKDLLAKEKTLCRALRSKAELLFKASMLEEAATLNQEALELAKEMDSQAGIEARFYSTLLAHKIHQNIEGLSGMLDDTTLGEEEKGTINYTLWQLTQGEKYRQQAVEIYQAYLEKTPNFVYGERVQEMLSS